MSDTEVVEQPPVASVAGAILVIDDDAAMREALLDILGLLTKATVYVAADGREGLEILKQRQNIALILLDMNMPVMNGEETYERVRKLAPQTRVIISSSLSPGEIKARLGRHKVPPLLQKPHSVTALLKVVRSVAPMGVA